MGRREKELISSIDEIISNLEKIKELIPNYRKGSISLTTLELNIHQFDKLSKNLIVSLVTPPPEKEEKKDSDPDKREPTFFAC